MEVPDCGRQWTLISCSFNSGGKNLDRRYLVQLDVRNPKIPTASKSGNFPQSYSSICHQSGLKFSGGSQLPFGISLSPVSLRHTRISCLHQYQGMERNGNIYETLMLNRYKCVDFKYFNVTLVR